MTLLGERHLGQSLLALGWTFGFDRAKRRAGCCRWRSRGRLVRRITVSRYFAQALEPDAIEAILRHEIAHALDYETRGRSAHDDVWKRWAQRCGADPSRLYDGEQPRIEAPYEGRCPACGACYPFFRRPKRPRACGACCDRHSGGRYDAAFRLRIRKR